MKDVKLHFTQQLTEDAKFSCYVSDRNGDNFKASSEITLDIVGKYLVTVSVPAATNEGDVIGTITL